MGKNTGLTLFPNGASNASEEFQQIIVDKLCEIAAGNNDEILECLDLIKGLLTDLNLPDIDGSLGTYGCTRAADGSIDGLVYVCKKTPSDGSDPTVELIHVSATDGTVTIGWTGAAEVKDPVAVLDDILAALTVPDVRYDYEPICNNGVLAMVTTTTTNGTAVQSAPVDIVPAIECDNPDDFEFVRYCNADGFTHIYVYNLNVQGTVPLADITTTESCAPAAKQSVNVNDCDLNQVSALVDSEVAVRGVVQVSQCPVTPAPEIEIDVEFVCNTDTNFYDRIVTTTTDGTPVEAAPVPTTTPCDEDKPQWQTADMCDINTLTRHIVTTMFETSGNTTLSDIDTGVPCVAAVPECVESQEWTYAVDNTGTVTNEDAVLTFTLSDGSTFDVAQTNQGALSQWTPQMAEWGANIQAQADASGLAWFVETRYIASAGSLAGGGGFSGPPSVPVSNALWADGMRARYVNIQICPGQPVPVSVVYNSATRTDYKLTTAGAVLGPIQKFVICRECGKEPIWYLEDGVTLASPAQIPNCYEPCGTLALVASPPGRDCTFEIDVACDNNNSDQQADFINTITRRATVCNGETIGVDYFQQDPNDATALIDYQLVGDFVDCATGEPFPVPVPPCDDFDLDTLWAIVGKTAGLNNNEWLHSATINASDLDAARDLLATFDFSQTPIVTGPITASVAQMRDADGIGGQTTIQIREGYICVSEPITIRHNATSEGTIIAEIGLCGGDYTEMYALSRTTGDPTFTDHYTIPVGIHKYKLTNVDNGGVNSVWSPFISTDGGQTFTQQNGVLDAEASTTSPYSVCKKVKVCKDTETVIDFLTGAVIDKADCTACELPCRTNPSVVASSQGVIHVLENCEGSEMYGINAAGETVWELPNPSFEAP